MSDTQCQFHNNCGGYCETDEQIEMNLCESCLQAEKEDSQMSFQVQELRPEVMAFALLMEARLREKDADKGQSWKGKSLFGLSTAALAKASFMHSACAINQWNASFEHAVDIANYCMFIADVAGGLEAPELERKSDNGGVGCVGLDQSRNEPLDIPAFLHKSKD